MSQSLALVLVHIIFSTKNRIAFLQSPDLRSEVHAYLIATLRGLDCEPLRVGGVGDHVQSAKEAVISYIASQEIHHRKTTFQEELRSLLKKHGIAFDERYVWD